VVEYSSVALLRAMVRAVPFKYWVEVVLKPAGMWVSLEATERKELAGIFI
jgi:hypothetical protein